MAVVAGFVHNTREELETLVEEMMRGVQVYNVMEIVDINPRLALAKFDAPLQATKFIRGRRNRGSRRIGPKWKCCEANLSTN